MSEYWKSLIPGHYIPLTKCNYVLRNHLSKCSNVEVVICTNSGQVFEFYKFRLVGSCKIPFSNPKEISLFTCYDLKCNLFYVIISETKELVVVSRGMEMKVVEHYKHVENYRVSDFSNAGYPQLGIWMKYQDSNAPDVVLDFTTEKACGEGSISNILNEKYQEVSLQVEEYREKLNMKKELRLYNCEKGTHSPPSEALLVDLVGRGGHAELKPLSKECMLTVTDTWQRIHNGKWIVGIGVCNNGERIIQDVQLVLKCSSGPLTYSSQMMQFLESDATSSFEAKRRKLSSDKMVAWREVTILEPGRTAFLLGVMPAPLFTSVSLVCLSGVVTYRTSQPSSTEYHATLPRFECRVEDFIRNSGAPFTSESSEMDLLAILASSYRVTLPVVQTSNFAPTLHELFVQVLHFAELPGFGCLFHRGDGLPELRGVLLHLNSTSPQRHSLTICARDEAQALLVVHCVYNALPVPQVLIRPPEVAAETPQTGDAVRTCLQAELQLLLDQRPTMSPEEYAQFRSQLSELELKTEWALSRIAFD